ncbi:MAG: tetratricopeptide repeat protein [Elusimicrobiota bacterium]|jgi:tetratricopeptide (TPR) repeat protein|nr:tetratricopeptide repeat protein [Elusimicrobiota bacterium]
MSKILLPLAALIAFGNICFAAEMNAAQIRNAQNSFNNGDYLKTIEIYETIVNVEKIHNPHIYYNLANAYFRNGDSPRALLNFERAYRLDPRDKDIRHNKKYILTLLERQDGLKQTQESFFMQWVSLNEITVFESVIFVILLLSAFVFIVKRKYFFKKAMTVSTLIFIIFLFVLIYKAYWQFENNAMILNAATIENSPSAVSQDSNEESPALHAGTFVHFISNRDNWSRIKVKIDGKTFQGWLPSERLGKI